MKKYLLLFLTLNISLTCAQTPYHHAPDGRFRNPEGEVTRDVKKMDMLKFLLHRITEKSFVDVPAGHVIPEQEALLLLKKYKNKDSITWLGHSSFLIQLQGKIILTDPFLTERAGFWFLGPKRFVAPAISIKHLPPIDIILVSHNHYEHLDLKTIKRLKDKHQIQVIVPLKLGKLFRKNGYHHIHELDWFDDIDIESIKITMLPAIHFSRRGLFDRNKTLWAGYMIADKKRKIYFAGDTADGKIFESIHEKYGAFDIAMLPIGAYLPKSIMKFSHLTPEQAVKAGKDLHAKTLVAMHWGTIKLTEEPPFEPPVRFEKAAYTSGFNPEQIWILRIGETRGI